MIATSSQSPSATRLTVLRVSGDAQTRGRAQGEALRELINAGVGRWLEEIGRRHGVDPDDYLAEFLAATGHVAAMKDLTPETLSEIEGVSAGSNQPLNRILAYNLLDEEWEYSEGRGTQEAPGCTVGGFFSSRGIAAIGQTMDIPSVHDGTQSVIVHERTEQPDLMVFTAAGIIGLMGVNDQGVGVVVNNLAMLPSSPTGLPVAAVARGIIDQSTTQTAIAFVKRVPHAIGQHYLIGGAGTLTSIEADASGVNRIPVQDGAAVHTNHPLASSWTAPESETWALANSRRRFERMAELMIGLETSSGLELALGDTLAPISRESAHGFMTFGAMVAELEVPPRARFAAGPPHLGEWVEVAFA